MKAQVIKKDGNKITVQVRRGNTGDLYAYNTDLSHLKIGDLINVIRQTNNPYLIYKGMFEVIE